MRILLLLIAASFPAFAATVNCTNNPATDLGLINTALAAGGSTTVNGPCSINGTINQHVASSVFRGGINAVLSATSNGSTLLDIAGSGITVTGIDFEHGNVNIGSAITNLTFTNNIIANITNSGGVPDGLVTHGMHGGTVSFNVLDNVMIGGYSDLTVSYPTYPGPIDAACWADYSGGLDGTIVQHNRFTRCGNDGFHINPSGPITAATRINISYNYCAQVHRACFEIQDFVGTAGLDMFGNVAINANAPFFDTFAYSIASVGSNFRFFNNLGSLNTQYCEGGVASFLEMQISPGTIQGNVNAQLPYNFYGALGPPTNIPSPPHSPPSCYTYTSGGSSAVSPPILAASNGDGTTNPSNTLTMESNIACGNDNVTQIDPFDGTSHTRNIVNTTGHNFLSTSACPMGANATSNVGVPVFVSPPIAFPSFGSGTWNVTEISALPILNMQFVVDGTTASTVEIQDVSSTFATDRKWLYHITYNTTGLSSGSHIMQAIATDVLGATQTSSSAFTAGTGTSPIVSFSPTSVGFGSQQVSIASSPFTVVMTNTGTAVLNISSIGFTGTNAGDFSRTTTCGATLAMAASCNILITFTPASTGARSASLSVADNAAGSPQTVALTGTGTAGPPACSGLLLNCDFNAGTTPWVVNVSPYGSWVVDTSGPGGVNAAHVSVTSAVPPGSNIELLQDAITLTPGQSYRLTFKSNVSRAQQLNILAEQDVPPFTNYGLTFTPIITAGSWNSYTTTFVATAGGSGDTRFTVQMDNAANGDSLEFTDFSLVPISSSEVTNIIFPYYDHSTVAVGFTTITDSNQVQIRYVQTFGGTPSCMSGTGGTVQSTIDIGIKATYGQISIGGLAPSTSYMICPEVSKDGGATWSNGAGAILTTKSLPSVHPSLPIPPIKFDTSYPDTASYATYNVLPDCSDFGSGGYVTALANWALSTPRGTIISIPAGTICTTTAGNPFAFSGIPPDVHVWRSADLSLPSTFTWTGGNHPFVEGDLVSFGRSYVGAPGSELTLYPTSTTCDVGYSTLNGGGIQSGQRYQVHVLTATTFQVRCLPDTQYDPAIPPPIPAIMAFTDTGRDTFHGFFMTPWKKFLNTHDGLMEWKRVLANGTPTPQIIVRSATPDNQLPPEGVQITPAWAPKMATFIDPVVNVTTVYPNASKGFILFGDPDANFENPIGDIRFGPGIEITVADYNGSVHSSDPAGYSNVLLTYPWDSAIIYDRIWYHLLGAANRANVDMPWNGAQLASVDSQWDNMTYFHANHTGLAPTRNSNTQFTIATGVAYAGFGPIPLNVASVCTISGGSTGTIFVYDNLLSSNAFTVAVPSGITATCTGTAAVSAVAAASNGACDATDGWPKTASGEVTVAQIACVTVTSGVIGTATAAVDWLSRFVTEGDAHMIGGIGPGPYIFQDNYSDGAGISWHWDASGAAAYRGDYTVYRNYLFTNPKYLPGSPTSDGLRYFDRQVMEHKGGQRINEIGNIFDTTWRDQTPDGTFYALTPLFGAWITDVNFQHNTFRHGSAVMEGINTTCPSDVPTSAPCARPAVRYRFQNNLSYDIDGYTYTAHNPGGSNGPGEGWNFQLYGVGDMIVDHNTYAQNRGNSPDLFTLDGTAVEGYQHTGNIEWITGVPGQTPFTVHSEIPLPPPGCTSLSNIGLINCALTQGIGNAIYNWFGNLVAGGWTDSSVPSGQITTSAMGLLLNGITNSYLATGTVPGTTTAIKWMNPAIDNIIFDYTLQPKSPYKASSNGFDNGSDLGANMILLNQAQGLVTLYGVPTSGITATGAHVSYNAPDSGVCWIDYSSTDPNVITAFTRVADSGGIRNRNTAITGLVTKTHYNYRLECSGNAPTSQRFGDFWTN